MKSSNARSSLKNHLGVHLATQLQVVGDLAHFGFADFAATTKDLALTVRAANTDLACAGKYRKAVCIINKVARTRTSEVVNRRVGVISQSRLAIKAKTLNSEIKNVLMRHFPLFKISCLER